MGGRDSVQTLIEARERRRRALGGRLKVVDSARPPTRARSWHPARLGFRAACPGCRTAERDSHREGWADATMSRRRRAPRSVARAGGVMSYARRYTMCLSQDSRCSCGAFLDTRASPGVARYGPRQRVGFFARAAPTGRRNRNDGVAARPKILPRPRQPPARFEGRPTLWGEPHAD